MLPTFGNHFKQRNQGHREPTDNTENKSITHCLIYYTTSYFDFNCKVRFPQKSRQQTEMFFLFSVHRLTGLFGGGGRTLKIKIK